jgi:ribosomal protein S27AE
MLRRFWGQLFWTRYCPECGARDLIAMQDDGEWICHTCGYVAYEERQRARGGRWESPCCTCGSYGHFTEKHASGIEVDDG